MSETQAPSPELRVPPFWKLLIPFVAARHYWAREKTEPNIVNGPLGVLMGISELVYPLFSLWLAKESNSWQAGVGTYALGRFALAYIASWRKN